jgi:hypothetical protein
MHEQPFVLVALVAAGGAGLRGVEDRGFLRDGLPVVEGSPLGQGIFAIQPFLTELRAMLSTSPLPRLSTVLSVGPVGPCRQVLPLSCDQIPLPSP